MWKYLGSGFVMGIPARDLTDEEVEKFGLKRIRATGLYQRIKEKPVEKETKHGRHQST